MTDPFDPGAISDETAAFNRWLEDELSRIKPVHEVPPALTRQARAEGKGVFPQAGPCEGSEWIDFPGAPGGPGRARLSLPGGEPYGTYLHVHGGGWTLGTPEQYDSHNQRIAAAAGCRVVSMQYRLAPEHPWPACIEDCQAATRWALETFDGPVVIGGESAGAHLSALVLLRLRAEGGLDRVAGTVLNYGIFDLRLTPSMANWGQRYLILSTPTTLWFRDNLNGPAPDDPAVSPLLADLTGLPPALVQIGTADPLLDDSLFMANRWRAAGNEAELQVYPGGVHAFDMFDLAIARASLARQDAFITRRIKAAAPA